MSPIYICGLGAVSPAGWGLDPFRSALEQDLPLPAQNFAVNLKSD